LTVFHPLYMGWSENTYSSDGLCLEIHARIKRFGKFTVRLVGRGIVK